MLEFSTKEELLELLRQLARHPLLADVAMGDDWSDQTVDAYFRGQAAGVAGAVMRVEEALAGKHAGVIANAPLNQLCVKLSVKRLQRVDFCVAEEGRAEGWYFAMMDGTLYGPYTSDIEAYIACGNYAESLEWLSDNTLDSYKRASRRSL